MATFPVEGLLLLDGFSEQPRPGVLRTDMDSGPPKQAPIESLLLNQRPVVYLFKSKADYQTFFSWWRDTIVRTGWFDWTDPVSATTKRARIAGGQIQPRPRRGDLGSWEVSMVLETLE